MRIRHTVLISLAALGPSCEQSAERKPAVAPKPRPPLRVLVSKETTYFTAPLRKDGGVDYIAALNRHYGKGVTPQNNAAVLLFRVFRPEDVSEELRKRFYRALGTPPPEKGSSYVSLTESAGLKPKGGAELDRLFGQLGQSHAGPWKGKDIPEIRKWIDANEEVLEILEKGAQRSRFFVPLMAAESRASMIDMNLPLEPNEPLRETAALLCSRANLHLGEGRIEEAVQDALTCHRWARLLEQSPSTFGWLVAQVADRMAFRIVASLIASGKLTGNQADACQRELEKLGPLNRLAEILEVGERCFMLDSTISTVRSVRSQLAPNANDDTDATGQFDINIALRELNRRQNRLVNVARISDPVKRRKAIKKLETDWINERKRLLRTASHKQPADMTVREASIRTAQIWCNLRAKADLTVLNADDGQHVRHDLTLLALALAAYYADHKRYPDKLDKLTPKYIAAIPADRFNGKPLHYTGAKTGFLLYSVGVNGRDDGGRYEYGRGRDDLAVRVSAK